MKFLFTPEEAQRPARAIEVFLAKKQMVVKVETAVSSEAPYRTTLLATKSGLSFLVEAQGTLTYEKPLRDLAAWLAANRVYAELYLATTSEGVLPLGLLADLDKDGIGLLIVHDNRSVVVDRKARNPALVVTPDPTLKFGDCRVEVSSALNKFNNVDRKDGLRDMCEIVERETENIIVRASRKGWLTKDEDVVKQLDWSSQINLLSSSQAYRSGKTPIISSSFKDDLHSFRNARNLVDHNVTSKRDDARRQKQFQERMTQGPRLVAELISLRRKIR
jgi:hypothetical protein